MAISKVVLNGRTLIDFTSDTVTPDTLEADYTATDARGRQIVGTYEGPSGTITITENGEGINVIPYASANVRVASAMSAKENWYITGIIPSIYENSEITKLGSSAFYKCSVLEIASFANVSMIGNSAFHKCVNLQNIYAPNCESIGVYTFAECSSLQQVSFPALKNMAAYAFYTCRNLSNAYIPQCISIDANGFAYCTNLQSMDLPNCTIIAGSAFSNCINLETISLPNCKSLNSAYTFYNCQKLQYIDLPECIYINTQTFNNCVTLSYANMPKLSNILGSSAFYNCKALASVSLPVCYSIGNNAFTGCDSLSFIYLPHTRYLSTSAFYNCSNLGVVILGNSVSSNMTGSFASTFSNCFRLLSLYILCSLRMGLTNSSTFSYTPIAGYTDYTDGVYGSIYVPMSMYGSYISATNWTYFSSRFVSMTDAEIETLLEGL